MSEYYTNLGTTTASGTINNSSNPVSIVVGGTTGFPTGTPFRIVVCDSAGTNAEVMLVTSTSAASGTTTFTATRGAWSASVAAQETPTPTLSTHSAGSLLAHVLTAGAMNQIRNDQTQIGTRAGLPSTTGQLIGNKYICKDSVYQYVFDGTVWQPFAYGVNVVEPVLSSFTQVHCGSSTFGTNNGGIIQSVPSASSNENNQLLLMTKTYTGSYYVDVAFTAQFYANNGGAGIILATSTQTGSEHVVGAWGFQGSFSAWQNKEYNSETNHNTDTGELQIEIASPLVWLRLFDDGTATRTWMTSPNGITWRTVYTEARTTWITPTYVGVGCVPYNCAMDVQWVHFSLHT